MPTPTVPITLLFSPYDPSGAGHLPADLHTHAALGCHALGVPTALLTGDTAHLEELHPTPPELIDAQARLLLEDMPVAAFQVGPLYTPESVSAVVQIAADYESLPLVLHLQSLPADDVPDEVNAEDAQDALIELLLPLADLVVADQSLLARWRQQGLLSGPADATPGEALLTMGARWSLTTGMAAGPGRRGCVLHGPQRQTARGESVAPNDRLSHPDAPLVCALTALLAQRQALPDLLPAALAQAERLAERHFQPGMGKRVLLHTSQPSS